MSVKLAFIAVEEIVVALVNEFKIDMVPEPLRAIGYSPP
jgi:hypothetical protein